MRSGIPGKQAIESATKACELTAWKIRQPIDTLAAGYAEAGDSESAVKWAGKALELAPESKNKSYQERLDLDKSRKPYRETNPAIDAK